MAWFKFNRNECRLISALLRPVFRRLMDGARGNAVDVLAVIVTAVGVATSLGVGALQISVRWAAASAIRRVLHEGQTPRPLQEKATRKSSPQSSQRTRAKPWANSACPQLVEGPPSRYLRNAFST